MLRLKSHNLNFYSLGERVEFYNKYGKWIRGKIKGFKINEYVYQAIIECEDNKCCRLHYICICSTYLRKCV